MIMRRGEDSSRATTGGNRFLRRLKVTFLTSKRVHPLTLRIDSAPIRPVKYFLPLFLLVAFSLSACNTLNNRRSMYTYEKVHGPYTRQLEEGTWGQPKTVTEEYAEQQRVKRGPKLVPGEKKSSSGSPSHGAGTGTQPTPDTPLPTYQ
jgi:hypothetical protein